MDACGSPALRQRAQWRVRIGAGRRPEAGVQLDTDLSPGWGVADLRVDVLLLPHSVEWVGVVPVPDAVMVADGRSGSSRCVAGISRGEMGAGDGTLRIRQEDSHSITPSSPPVRRVKAA